MVHSSSERDFNLVMVESHNSEDVVPSMSNFSDFLTIPVPAAVLRSPAKLRISIKRNFLIVPFSQHSRDLRGQTSCRCGSLNQSFNSAIIPKATNQPFSSPGSAVFWDKNELVSATYLPYLPEQKSNCIRAYCGFELIFSGEHSVFSTNICRKQYTHTRDISDFSAKAQSVKFGSPTKALKTERC